MPVINTPQLFLEKKKNTIPFVKLPRNLKESLNIDKAHPNGIFKIEPGEGTLIYDACYIFEDICYINQDWDKQNSTLEYLIQLFKSIKNQIKFTIANEQTDVQEFVEGIFKPIYGEDYPLVKKGIGRWINQKVSEGTRNIQRLMYLTVTVRARSFEEAQMYITTLDASLQGIFASLGSRLYRMSGEERLAVLQRILRLGAGGIPPRNISPDNDGWKNQILPVYSKSEGDYLVVNSRYVSVLCAQDYASGLNEEKVVHSLTDTLFPTYVTLDIEPVPARMVKDKALYTYTNNDRMIAQENHANVNAQRYGQEPSYELKNTRDEIEGILDKVDREDNEGIYLGMLVLVAADSEEELVQRVETLQQIAVDNDYTLEPYMRMQRKALMTVLPIGGRQVNNMRFLLTSSSVAWQPFYSKDLLDKDGVVMGLNRETNRLLLGNRKHLPNPHSIVVGYTGFGKSFFIKTVDIAQPLIFTDDDILMIDPNDECRQFIMEVGGQFFDLKPQSQYYYNPFEVPLHVWNGDTIVRNRFVSRKSEFGGRFASACMDGISTTRIHRSYVEEAVKEMYEEYFTAGRYKKQPTLVTVWEKLKQRLEQVTLANEKEMLFNIVKCLESYTTGVYDMFAHPTNIDVTNRLTGFGLMDIPDEARKPVMLTLMHFVSTRIEENQDSLKASRLIVDETQILTADEFTISELHYAVAIYRKIGGIVTLCMQNVTHALNNSQLCNMFSNCGYKVFFDQGGVGAVELAKIIKLSEVEYKKLGEGKVGCGVLVWNKDVFLMDGKMNKDNELYPLFNTDFHEKAADKKIQEENSEGFVLRKRILSLLSKTPMKKGTLMNMCTAGHRISTVEKTIRELSEAKEIEKDGETYHLPDMPLKKREDMEDGTTEEENRT